MLRLKFGSYEDVAKTYQVIEKEFPVKERKELAIFQKLYLSGDYKLILSYDEADHRVGFAYVFQMNALSVIWLDFIVIEDSYQGLGYGTEFIKSLHKMFPEMGTMVLEVEIPTGDDPNQVRRIKYYERLGAERLDVVYYIPNPYERFQMYLYALPIVDASKDIYEKLPEVVGNVYRFIHADVLGTDQLLEQTIKSLENRK